MRHAHIQKNNKKKLARRVRTKKKISINVSRNKYSIAGVTLQHLKKLKMPITTI